MALSNAAAFFSELRSSRLLGSGLEQSEVDGINAMLVAFSAARWPVSWAAYALATAFHESAGTMQPVKEYGGKAYFTRMYDILGARPAKARELGNLVPGDGARYCGRGWPQLTGKSNYAKASTVVGVDLVAAPDRAMEVPIAAKIMVSGMEQGWFTGRKLRDDLPRLNVPADFAAFKRSRDIINGHDKEDKIAVEAVAFQKALVLGGWA